VLKAVNKFDPERGSFGAYSAACVRNRVRLLRRRILTSTESRKRVECEVESAEAKLIEALSPDTVEALTELQRTTIHQRYTLSMRFSEIGRIRNVSRQAAHRVHSRAINQLRRRMSES
jgi:RNA polymerase sigma factor (sigma-70 family)